MSAKTKKIWRCIALVLNRVGAVCLYVAISVAPATAAAPGGGTERYIFFGGETAAMIGSEHPWCLVAGWFLLILGFAIQLIVEIREQPGTVAPWHIMRRTLGLHRRTLTQPQGGRPSRGRPPVTLRLSYAATRPRDFRVWLA
jgi:hypothetical protein